MAIEDVGAKAEAVIKSLIYKDNRGRDKIDLTTGQIRKVLTAINALTNKITVYKSQNEEMTELPEELVAEVKFLKVKIAYQAGRDKNRGTPVKAFVDKAKLFERIDAVANSIAAWENFSRYMEALVAYHKFYGGRD